LLPITVAAHAGQSSHGAGRLAVAVPASRGVADVEGVAVPPGPPLERAFRVKDSTAPLPRLGAT
jgi:hypothetical protein